jgi:hypothetical protein
MTSASACGATHLVKSAWGMSARLAGVSMIDGSTALTVIPQPFTSSARLSVKRCTPALEAAYGPMPAPDFRVAFAPMFIIRPVPLLRM